MGFPRRVESRQVREGGHGVAQGEIGRIIVALLGRHDVVQREHPFVRLRWDILVRDRGLEISATRIRGDPERYGADAGVDGVKVVLVPRAVVIDGDNKVRRCSGLRNTPSTNRS